MKQGVLDFCLRIVEAAGRIVPEKWLGAWRQEWEAEIQHRWQKLQEWNRATWKNQMKLFKRTLGAISDAAWLRQQFTWDLDVMQDIRFGLRMLRKNPAFTLVAVLTLALGIGANTAIFSFSQALFLQSLPVESPKRLALIEGSWSYPDYLDFRENNEVFTSMASFTEGDGFVLLLDSNGSTQVHADIVTQNYFEVLGLRPHLGNFFHSTEQISTNAYPYVVLSFASWQGRFGGDPGIVGKPLQIAGRGTVEVLGVAPRDFRSIVLGEAPELWIPTSVSGGSEVLQTRSFAWLQPFGRLRKGVTLEQAQSNFDLLAGRLQQRFPEIHENTRVSVSPIANASSYIHEQARLPLILLSGTVGLILLIACANVANLLLIRGLERRQELAVRMALGASPIRLGRQLIVESLLLAGLGGVTGILLSGWLTSLRRYLSPFDLTNISFEANWVVAGFGLGLSLATILVFGLVPAWTAVRRPVVPNLRSGAGSGHLGRSYLRNSFVVVQVALTLPLMITAGLLTQTLAGLYQVDRGFDLEGVQAVRLRLDKRSSEERQAFLSRLVEQVEARPGVKSTALVAIQIGFGNRSQPVTLPGTASDTSDRISRSSYNVIGAGGYFEMMGIPLLAGRDFDSRDRADAPPAIILNEALAERLWPGEPVARVLGRTVNLPQGEKGPSYPTVVGVARSTRYRSLRDAPEPYFYLPVSQNPQNRMTLLTRTTGDLQSLAKWTRRAVHRLDPEILTYHVHAFGWFFDPYVALPRAMTILLVLFSFLGLCLAVVGLYGTLSHAVRQRTHEIGIRMALGASQPSILRLLLRQGILLTLAGIAVGLPLSAASSNLLRNLLYGIAPTDPATYLLVSVLFVGIAVLACYIPARRATKVDPMVALRYE